MEINWNPAADWNVNRLVANVVKAKTTAFSFDPVKKAKSAANVTEAMTQLTAALTTPELKYDACTSFADRVATATMRDVWYCSKPVFELQKAGSDPLEDTPETFVRAFVTARLKADAAQSRAVFAAAAEKGGEYLDTCVSELFDKALSYILRHANREFEGRDVLPTLPGNREKGGDGERYFVWDGTRIEEYDRKGDATPAN